MREKLNYFGYQRRCQATAHKAKTVEDSGPKATCRWAASRWGVPITGAEALSRLRAL